MFGDNPRIAAWQARADPNVYIRYWKTSLCSAPGDRPGYCCYAAWCGWCASYGLRKQAIYGDMSRYICCQGACPCSGRCCESSCPACCLCLEVSCCFAMSVAATRYAIQDELLIQTTKCDNCIIGTMIVLEYVACICHIVACITGSDEIRMAAHIIQIISDLVWCSVCACMQTQHKSELDQRDQNPGLYRPVQAPAVQMIPMGAAMPQAGGYAPPQPQAQYMPYAGQPMPGYAPMQGYAPIPGAYQQPPFAGAQALYAPQAYPQQQLQQQQQAGFAAPPPGYIPTPYPYPAQQMYR